MSDLCPTMPHIPDDIFTDILKIVSRDQWWDLAPILKAGRRGRDVVYKPEVLKEACIYNLCYPEDINTSHNPNGRRRAEGRHRRFFKRYYDTCNKIAIYYEGLRVIAEDKDLKRGIEILSRNVLGEVDATIACGILSIIGGNEEMAVYYLHEFGERYYPLSSEGVRLTGEDFVHELSTFRTARNNTYKDSFIYPYSPLLLIPYCAFLCCLQYGHHTLIYGDYDILCKNCYIWWLSKKVCELLQCMWKLLLSYLVLWNIFQSICGILDLFMSLLQLCSYRFLFSTSNINAYSVQFVCLVF